MTPKISATSNCAVIGYGSWATAIVKLLCENEHKVWWYVANPAVKEHIQTRGHNHKYLPSISFSKEQIVVSERLDEVVSAADIIILAVPSAFLTNTLWSSILLVFCISTSEIISGRPSGTAHTIITTAREIASTNF